MKIPLLSNPIHADHLTCHTSYWTLRKALPHLDFRPHANAELLLSLHASSQRCLAHRRRHRPQTLSWMQD